MVFKQWHIKDIIWIQEFLYNFPNDHTFGEYSKLWKVILDANLVWRVPLESSFPFFLYSSSIKYSYLTFQKYILPCLYIILRIGEGKHCMYLNLNFSKEIQKWRVKKSFLWKNFHSTCMFVVLLRSFSPSYKQKCFANMYFTNMNVF